jgi:hypothetical protein
MKTKRKTKFTAVFSGGILHTVITHGRNSMPVIVSRKSGHLLTSIGSTVMVSQSAGQESTAISSEETKLTNPCQLHAATTMLIEDSSQQKQHHQKPKQKPGSKLALAKSLSSLTAVKKSAAPSIRSAAPTLVQSISTHGLRHPSGAKIADTVRRITSIQTTHKVQHHQAAAVDALAIIITATVIVTARVVADSESSQWRPQHIEQFIQIL